MDGAGIASPIKEARASDRHVRRRPAGVEKGNALWSKPYCGISNFLAPGAMAKPVSCNRPKLHVRFRFA
jgi:hypothetical protein